MSTVSACGEKSAPSEQLAQAIEEGLSALDSVQGRLSIQLQDVVLEQELWVQRPNLLRTETESGPAAYSGTIVVLNERQGWVYTPAVNIVTVVDRSNYQPELAGQAGAGSVLERMPAAVLDAIQSGYPINIGETTAVAGHEVTPVEIVIPQAHADFPAGPFHVWVDQEYGYPLAWQDSTGRRVRFLSIEFNMAIDPLTFTFVPPPGANVRRVQPD